MLCWNGCAKATCCFHPVVFGKLYNVKHLFFQILPVGTVMKWTRTLNHGHWAADFCQTSKNWLFLPRSWAKFLPSNSRFPSIFGAIESLPWISQILTRWFLFFKIQNCLRLIYLTRSHNRKRGNCPSWSPAAHCMEDIRQRNSSSTEHLHPSSNMACQPIILLRNRLKERIQMSHVL